MGEMKPPAPVMRPPAEKKVESAAEKQKKMAMMPPPPPVFAAAPAAPKSTPEMMMPPPPSIAPDSDGSNVSLESQAEEAPQSSEPAEKKLSQRPYEIPEWSHAPAQPYTLEVLKGGSIIERLEVSEKGAYMFGRHESCDFVLDHPSISRFHAVLQFNSKGNAFVFDLASTHGTFVNKLKVKAKVHVPLSVGSMFKLGQSSRFYVFQGPQELMPQEGLSRKGRQLMEQLEARQMKEDEEASLLRARMEAQNAQGASWGMGEDAVDEETEEDDLTWQNYTGQLNEKQQKTLEQVQKRNEKLTNLKKEIDAIQAKENAQGGLTQGQQTQVSRNEKRIEEILEQLESLEENLNDSIKESVLGKPVNKRKKKNAEEEDDDHLSDEDEFYDRTKKKQKKNEVETAASLLGKMDQLAEEMDEIRVKLAAEEDKEPKRDNGRELAEDPLDAFMTNVSHEIEEDTSARLQKELERLQGESDRLSVLLRVADPSGEAAHKWRNKVDEQPEEPVLEKPEPQLKAREEEPTPETPGAIWIGAPRPEAPAEDPAAPGDSSLAPVDEVGDDDDEEKFVQYRDRKEILESARGGVKSMEVEASEAAVADDIALLLRYKKGLTSNPEADEGGAPSLGGGAGGGGGNKQRRKKKKKMLGPERPNFMGSEEASEQASWVPPAGQTGDGRTSLNEKYGY